MRLSSSIRIASLLKQRVPLVRPATMPEALAPIDNVTKLTPSVVRILAGNPGKFTLQGTNTYLVSDATAETGDGARADAEEDGPLSCILIDTGEGKESYIDTLRSVLQGQDAHAGSSKRHIADIVLTHWHKDHVGGLPSVLTLLHSLKQPPPRIHKFLDKELDVKVMDELKEVPLEYYRQSGADGQGAQTPSYPSALHPLQDGSLLHLPSSDGNGGKAAQALQVVCSPGHTADHICLFLRQQGILFAGDHVLGQGTSIFDDLGAYLNSLSRCKQILESNPGPSSQSRLFSAHGPVIEDGVATLQHYIDHRLEREQQILDLLAKKSPGSASAHGDETQPKSAQWTILEIVSTLYSDYPESVYPAAARGIFLHLRKLAVPDEEARQRNGAGTPADGPQVSCSRRTGEESKWERISPPDLPKEESKWMSLMELGWSLKSSPIANAKV